MPIKSGAEVKSISKTDDIFEIAVNISDEIKAKSIIIATGKNPRRLNVPGEKEFENRGVVYCSTCDAPLFGGKRCGSGRRGNSGLNSAYDLLKYAVKIYVMENSDKLIGDEFLQEKLKKSGKVEFMTGVEIKEIKGVDFMEEVVYLDKKSGEEKALNVQGLFVNVGWVPATGFLKDFVKLNDYKEIIIDPKTNETSVKGVFLPEM